MLFLCSTADSHGILADGDQRRHYLAQVVQVSELISAPHDVLDHLAKRVLPHHLFLVHVHDRILLLRPSFSHGVRAKPAQFLHIFEGPHDVVSGSAWRL